MMAFAAALLASTTNATIVSEVDLDPIDGHKPMLRLDGKPWLNIGIQVRLDKLRYAWNFGEADRKAVVKRAAEDGFNTLAIPITWREVEPSKDRFDWATLDEYMGLCRDAGVRMEMLWFSWSSGGRIQWLDEKNKVLRVPDYVCTPQGASEFTVVSKTDPWTLDWNDNELMEREKYVLSKVMAHIAEWDAANGSSHTVIGVQLGNEPLGHDQTVAAERIIEYYDYVGAAVKESDYSVWTRLNCVNGQHTNRINANEALRAEKGTNIDFVGIDVYGTTPEKIASIMPFKGKNLRMIMESGAEVSDAAIYQMAALSGNTGYIHYDFLGPDGHGLYARDGNVGFKETGSTKSVRATNWLQQHCMTDLARNANGYGLYVHNAYADSKTATESEEGIVFVPTTTSSQGVSIRRSATEVLLMATEGGAFTLPEKMVVESASAGCFDAADAWVEEKSMEVVNGKISVAANTVVRVVVDGEDAPATLGIVQAEFGAISGTAEVSTKFTGVSGFAGQGFVRMGENGKIEWADVDGLDDGKVALGFRYACSAATEVEITVNGESRRVTLPATGGARYYAFDYMPLTLHPGKVNAVSVATVGKNVSIDEVRIAADDGSFGSVSQLSDVVDAVRVYPNPVGDVLYCSGVENADVSIFTTDGRLVQKAAGISSSVDVSSLAAGSYVVCINEVRRLILKK